MASYIVDFQAFKGLVNEFYLKEVAIVNIHSDTVYHWIIRPPTMYCNLNEEMQLRVNYLTYKIHGIPWQTGYIDESEVIALMKNILKNAAVVYIKGSERVTYLRNLLKGYRNVTVYDLDHFEEFLKPECKKKNLKFKCTYDRPNHKKLRCALEQVTRYRDILRKEFYAVYTAHAHI